MCGCGGPARGRSLASPAGQEDPRQFPVRWGLSAHARRLLTLALAGLIIAIVTRRPEFAGLAAPALLLLATWRTDRPAEVSVRASLASTILVEGVETIVGIEIHGLGDFGAALAIAPDEALSARPPGLLPPA